MDFARRQATPGRRFASLAFVVTLHLLLAWALATGLAQRVADLLPQSPLEIRLIKAEPPPPPPPRPRLLTQPRLAPPPPPRFIPPPEFEVTQPPEVTLTASPIPHSMAGPGTEPSTPQKGAGLPGNGTSASTGPSSTPPQLDFSKCRLPPYPEFNVQGTTLVVFIMDIDGTIPEAIVGRSSGPTDKHKVLDRLAVKFVRSCSGTPGTVNGKPVPLRGLTPVSWTLNN